MTGKYSTQFECLFGKISQEEWETRVTLAACYRLMDKFGMTDLIKSIFALRLFRADGIRFPVPL